VQTQNFTDLQNVQVFTIKKKYLEVLRCHDIQVVYTSKSTSRAFIDLQFFFPGIFRINFTSVINLPSLSSAPPQSPIF